MKPKKDGDNYLLPLSKDEMDELVDILFSYGDRYEGSEDKKREGIWHRWRAKFGLFNKLKTV